MLFKEVIGQDATKAMFRQMVSTDRLPHALLLLTPPGSGGLPLALALAQYLLCENRTDDACGVCSHCKKAAKFIHPDFHFSFPTVGSKVTSDHFLPQWREALNTQPFMEINDWLQHIGAENKQGNINKDECQAINRKLMLKSFESPVKIMLLWLPEYLGNEGNRLLKLIEEPPANTYFILVAENQERILNTILSRCQLVKGSTLSDEEVTTALVEQKQLSESQAAALAQLVSGNLNEALAMAVQETDDQAVEFLKWMRICFMGKPTKMVEWASSFASVGRENQKHFIRYALHFWREFLVLKAMGEEKVRLRAEEKKTAMGMAKVIGLEQLEEIIRLCNETVFHIERNANPKIILLDVSIQINHIIKHWKEYQAKQSHVYA